MKWTRPVLGQDGMDWTSLRCRLLPTAPVNGRGVPYLHQIPGGVELLGMLLACFVRVLPAVCIGGRGRGLERGLVVVGC
jgi:hypothetical protein